MENTKLTVEEVERLTKIQQDNAAIATELGNLEITKLQIEARRDKVIEYFNELRTEENSLGEELSKKYGNGTIDLEKGEFIPTP
tara:strand:- start:230 stop:481 length:252 start_codon:yes stop_codon:yes gene_type:complete